MKTEWSRSMSYNFLYSRKGLLRQTNYCVKLNSKSNGKKISQIGLRELEKHSFCQLHFDQLIARRRCTWVCCKPMIRKVFGSVNMMVKTESTHHKRMSPNLMFAEEGWFWPKLPGTPLRALCRRGSSSPTFFALINWQPSYYNFVVSTVGN